MSIIARIDHCNIVAMKEYFLKLVRDVFLPLKKECYLSMIMEFIPSSLNIMIKEQRKLKKPFPAAMRKVLAFQMFKALYYMNVHHRLCSSLVFVIETSNPRTSLSTIKHSNSKFAISAQPKSSKKRKVTSRIFARDTTARLN